MNFSDTQPIKVTIYVGDKQIENMSYYSSGEWNEESVPNQFDNNLTEFIAYLKVQLKNSLSTTVMPHEFIKRKEYDALEQPAPDVLYIVMEEK